MRIFGVDPGTATTGYGVLDVSGRSTYRYIASGIISTPKDMPMHQRLHTIRADALSLLAEYAPDVLVIEQLFFFRNATTVIPVAQARGVLLEAAATYKISVAEYTPMQVKLNLTGYGRADKKMVQELVMRLLDHQTVIKPDDAADAVALCICHARAGLGFSGTARGGFDPAVSLVSEAE